VSLLRLVDDLGDRGSGHRAGEPAIEALEIGAGEDVGAEVARHLETPGLEDADNVLGASACLALGNRSFDDWIPLGEQGAGDRVVAGGGVEEGGDRQRPDEAAIVDGVVGGEGAPVAGSAIPFEELIAPQVEAKDPADAALGEAAGLAGRAGAGLSAGDLEGELLDAAAAGVRIPLGGEDAGVGREVGGLASMCFGPCFTLGVRCLVRMSIMSVSYEARCGGWPSARCRYRSSDRRRF
jgi:hypothetical protein